MIQNVHTSLSHISLDAGLQESKVYAPNIPKSSKRMLKEFVPLLGLADLINLTLNSCNQVSRKRICFRIFLSCMAGLRPHIYMSISFKLV